MATTDNSQHASNTPNMRFLLESVDSYLNEVIKSASISAQENENFKILNKLAKLRQSDPEAFKQFMGKMSESLGVDLSNPESANAIARALQTGQLDPTQLASYVRYQGETFLQQYEQDVSHQQSPNLSATTLASASMVKQTGRSCDQTLAIAALYYDHKSNGSWVLKKEDYQVPAGTKPGDFVDKYVPRLGEITYCEAERAKTALTNAPLPSLSPRPRSSRLFPGSRG